MYLKALSNARPELSLFKNANKNLNVKNSDIPCKILIDTIDKLKKDYPKCIKGDNDISSSNTTKVNRPNVTTKELYNIIQSSNIISEYNLDENKLYIMKLANLLCLTLLLFVGMINVSCEQKPKEAPPAPEEPVAPEAPQVTEVYTVDEALNPLTVYGDKTKVFADSLNVQMYELILEPGDSIGLHSHLSQLGMVQGTILKS